MALGDVSNVYTSCLFVQVDVSAFDTTNESRNRRRISIKEDPDREYAINGHWFASATYADGTEVEKEFPYTAENYREEQEEQYRLESWLLRYHPDCTWYSVSFVEDW